MSGLERRRAAMRSRMCLLRIDIDSDLGGWAWDGICIDYRLGDPGPGWGACAQVYMCVLYSMDACACVEAVGVFSFFSLIVSGRTLTIAISDVQSSRSVVYCMYRRLCRSTVMLRKESVVDDDGDGGKGGGADD